jgi:cell division protein FtsW (lipid II flippase)
MTATRNREAALLVAALAAVAFAWGQVQEAMTGSLGDRFWLVVAAFAALAAAAHLMVRRFAPAADPALLPAVVLLNGLGLAMIHRLDLGEAQRAEAAGLQTPQATAPSQLLWTALAVTSFAVILILIRDHRVLQRYTFTSMVVGLILLLLPLLPVLGVTINGARIWVRAFGLSFQPAEVAKVLLIIFFAGYLNRQRDSLRSIRAHVLGVPVPRAKDLGPILLAWAVSMGVLIFERDLGAALLLFGVFVVMLAVATERFSWILLGAVLFAAGAFFAYQLFGHVRTRVDIWLDPFADPSGSGYQVVQSLYGLANGGLLGAGWGQGSPGLVPFAKTDFIVSALGEELGLTGLMVIVLVYLVIVQRGIATALRVRDVFGRLLATGLAFVIGFQVFVIVGGVSGLIPLTGLTTPFLSAGGSSLLANWVIVALLMRVSDAARRPPPPPPPAPEQAATQVVPVVPS